MDSFRFLWPCIVSKVWRERKPTSCNNQMLIINFCLNMFRLSLCPSSGEQRPCVTACGVLRWFFWVWLVAVVGRCVVGFEHVDTWRSQWPRGLRHESAAPRLLGLLESDRGLECMCLTSVVFCQAQVCAAGWLLVQGIPTECGVPECDRKASMMRRPSLIKVCCAVETKNLGTSYYRGERGETVSWGVALQTGRSRVRFPMVSSEFPAALWPWRRLSLKQNEYQEYLFGER